MGRQLEHKQKEESNEEEKATSWGGSDKDRARVRSQLRQRGVVVVFPDGPDHDDHRVCVTVCVFHQYPAQMLKWIR